MAFADLGEATGTMMSDLNTSQVHDVCLLGLNTFNRGHRRKFLKASYAFSNNAHSSKLT